MVLKKKRKTDRELALEHVIKDIWWLSRRYATGRQNYAVKMFNDAMKTMQSLGIHVEPDPIDDTIWAEDGHFGYPPEYSGGRPQDYIHIDKLKELALHYDKKKGPYSDYGNPAQTFVEDVCQSLAKLNKEEKS
jgi:hypothetical protein